MTHIGDNGLALVMKIAVNLNLAVQMQGFCEGVLLAEKERGIPREVAVDVMTHSVVASPMVQYRGPFVLHQPDEAWFRRQHDAKRYAARHGAGPSIQCSRSRYRREQ